MKRLVHDLLRDWQVWALFSAPAMLVVIAVIASAAFTQRRLDASNVAVVKQVQVELKHLREEIQQADRERDQLRQAVEPLKGLSKAIEAVKDATEPVKGGRP